jgi:MOSC domain-containing protein YiiM
MKTVVRLNKNNAGVYGTVIRTGTIRVGDPVRFAPSGQADLINLVA